MLLLHKISNVIYGQIRRHLTIQTYTLYKKILSYTGRKRTGKEPDEPAVGFLRESSKGNHQDRATISVAVLHPANPRTPGKTVPSTPPHPVYAQTHFHDNTEPGPSYPSDSSRHRLGKVQLLLLPDTARFSVCGRTQSAPRR